MNFSQRFPAFHCLWTFLLTFGITPLLHAAPDLTAPPAEVRQLPEKAASLKETPQPAKPAALLREYAWMQDNPLQPAAEAPSPALAAALQTPTPPDESAAWSPARSNPAFSFLKECTGSFEDCRLWLRDNSSQEIKLLAETASFSGINDTFDVNPQGTAAIFETMDPQTAGSLSIHILPLNGGDELLIPQISYSSRSLFGIHFIDTAWNPSGGGSILLETLVYETPEAGQQGLFKPAPYLVLLGDRGPQSVALTPLQDNPRYAFYAGMNLDCTYNNQPECPASLVQFDMAAAAVRTLDLEGSLISAVYHGNQADFTIQKRVCTPAGPSQECQNSGIFLVSVDLTTLEILHGLPQGWTPAHSNANFAFQLDGEYAGSPQTLRLLNLNTGEIRELVTFEADIYGGIYSRSFPGLMFDVSPDGTKAVFERIHFRYYDYTHEIFVQPLAGGSAGAVVNGISNDSRGILKSIAFERTGIRLTAQLTDFDGTVFEKRYLFSSAAGTARETGASLITKGKSVYFERDSGLLIFFPRHASLEGFEIYQMVRGTTELKHLLHVDVPLELDQAANYSITLIDIQKTFQGQPVVSVGVKTAYGTQTIVVDVNRKTVKRFEGAVYRILYTRFWSFYWVRYLDNTSRILRVPLPRLGFQNFWGIQTMGRRY